MKYTIFSEILNEEFIAVNQSVPETIKCLCEQSGTSYANTANGLKLYFYCSRKGKISVKSSYYHREGLFPIYYVYGNVISKDNKTYVKVLSVYRKSDIWLRAIVSFLIIPLIILSLCLNKVLYLPAVLISFIVAIIGIIDFIKATSIRKKCAFKAVKIMENEIIKRVKNIEHWNN